MPVDGGAAGTTFDAAAAWIELHARLRAFVARRVGDPHVADDLAQDILLRIHQRMGDLRDEERLDAWAYQVARNAIVDHYRVRGAEREQPAGDAIERMLDTVEDPAATTDADREDVRREFAGCLTPMVRRLPAPYREAIELTDLGAMTQAAAAAHLGLSVPGMKARVQRARLKLRAMLLECCEVATDLRGGITGYEPHGDCGGSCGCDGARSRPATTTS